MVLGDPHEMVLEIVDRVLASSKSTHTLTVLQSLPLDKREFSEYHLKLKTGLYSRLKVGLIYS